MLSRFFANHQIRLHPGVELKIKDSLPSRPVMGQFEFELFRPKRRFHR